MSKRLSGSFTLTGEQMQTMLPPGVQIGDGELKGIVQSVEGNEAVIVCGDDDPPLLHPGPVEHVATMPSDVWIYRQTNSVGGHTYFSDAIGSGVMIWDTCLVSAEELRFVLELEEERRKAE